MEFPTDIEQWHASNVKVIDNEENQCILMEYLLMRPIEYGTEEYKIRIIKLMYMIIAYNTNKTVFSKKKCI